MGMRKSSPIVPLQAAMRKAPCRTTTNADKTYISIFRYCQPVNYQLSETQLMDYHEKRAHLYVKSVT